MNRLRKGDTILVEGFEAGAGEKVHAAIVTHIQKIAEDGKSAVVDVTMFPNRMPPMSVHTLLIFDNEDGALAFLVNWRYENSKKPEPQREANPPALGYLRA